MSRSRGENPSQPRAQPTHGRSWRPSGTPRRAAHHAYSQPDLANADANNRPGQARMRLESRMACIRREQVGARPCTASDAFDLATDQMVGESVAVQAAACQIRARTGGKAELPAVTHGQAERPLTWTPATVASQCATSVSTRTMALLRLFLVRSPAGAVSADSQCSIQPQPGNPGSRP
jgi:hypothetical protein